MQSRAQLDAIRDFLQGQGLGLEASPSRVFDEAAVAVRDPDGWLNLFGIPRADLPSNRAVNDRSARALPGRLQHVVVASADLPAMMRFYEQALGFKVERRLDRISLVQLRAGASLLDLVPGERVAGGANMDHLCFRIEPFDRDAIVSRLAPFGISVGETVERYGAEGDGPSVYFDDPEGNQIELKGPSDGKPPPA